MQDGGCPTRTYWGPTKPAASSGVPPAIGETTRSAGVSASGAPLNERLSHGTLNQRGANARSTASHPISVASHIRAPPGIARSTSCRIRRTASRRTSPWYPRPLRPAIKMRWRGSRLYRLPSGGSQLSVICRRSARSVDGISLLFRVSEPDRSGAMLREAELPRENAPQQKRSIIHAPAHTPLVVMRCKVGALVGCVEPRRRRGSSALPAGNSSHTLGPLRRSGRARIGAAGTLETAERWPRAAGHPVSAGSCAFDATVKPSRSNTL